MLDLHSTCSKKSRLQGYDSLMALTNLHRLSTPLQRPLGKGRRCSTLNQVKIPSCCEAMRNHPQGLLTAIVQSICCLHRRQLLQASDLKADEPTRSFSHGRPKKAYDSHSLNSVLDTYVIWKGHYASNVSGTPTKSAMTSENCTQEMAEARPR